MFCPSCSSEQRGQYCRSCGKDLRPIHAALENPDAIMAPANSARDEIGRAFADKIRDLKSAKDLSKVVEDVLPQIAQFLETPEEKRLRRIRAGVITAAIGMGAALGFTLYGLTVKSTAPNDDDYLGFFFLACSGLATFLIGLGIMFNGWRFTVPKKLTIEQPSEPSVKTTTEFFPKPAPEAAAPKAAAQEPLFKSLVTEHTTRQLSDDQ
ncbi:MAG TPA: hypothetical protein VJ810_19665 [Blastocatellia bacterium]|nr:hypothetical protein [Blastocatellia bacterium]